jgi:putative tryptophan/tyrosine transport system substrate-binding protein
MKNRFFIKPLLAFVALGISLLASPLSAETKPAEQPTKTIGIIVPMEHAALQAIIDGFKTTLQAEYKQKVVFHVGNAMGDTNLQRSIIQQFMNQKVDMFVPIGIASTQMTLSMVKEKPIVSLAASYSEADRKKRNPRNITGVYDELGGTAQMTFVRGLFPNLKKMTLIHSNAEKIFQEVADITAIAEKEGITIQKLVVNTLPDLYSVSKTIAADSQAILVLKDHLIVSGIRTVAKAADDLKIPLVAADEGSISEGAAIALGVSENVIGAQGAKLAAQILNGKPIANFPMEDPARPNIFLNKAAAARQNLDITPVTAYAKERQYELVEIAEKAAPGKVTASK